MVGKRISCLIIPFNILWRLALFIIKIAARLAIVSAGLLLMAIGVMVSFTIIGAIIGIPLIVLGFLLLIKGIF